MKKVLGIVLTLLVALTFVFVSSAKAEEVLGDEYITNGTFTTNVSGGVATLNTLDSFAGGDWTPEGHTYLAEDPVVDYVVRIDYSAAMDNMYIMVPVTTTAGDVVKVSLDYYVTGTCTNFGLGFWCTTTNARLLEHVFAEAPTEGWQHAEWSYDPSEGDLAYDSIHMWCVGQSEGSQAYFKNLTVTLNDETTNLVTFGDLNEKAEVLGDNKELLLNGVDAIAAGDWTPEGHTYFTTDPIVDVALRIDYSAAMDNMYIMAPVTTTAGDVVKVSLDYLVNGTCTNFGLGFWCTTTSARLLEHVFAGAPTEGWQHAEWSYDPSEGDFNYDSMHIWCVGQSEGSQAFIKNFKVTLNDETENLITSGDFNAFKEYLISDSAILTDEADDYLNTGSKAKYTGSEVFIEEGGNFAHNRPFPAGKYYVDAVGSMPDDAEGTVKFLDAEGNALDTHELLGSFGYNVELETAAVKFVIEVTKGTFTLDTLSVKPIEEKATSFDEYYQSKTTTVNGDFETFEEGTKFSEVQLEGAWGSVSLDAPAEIVSKDGSKAFVIHTDATHTYTSAFLMLPDTLEVGDILRLSYDVKLEIESETTPTVLNSCLVGGSNTSYYTINISKLVAKNWANMQLETEGAERVNYPIKVQAKENGWYNLTIDFELTSADLIQTDSVRWLLSSSNNNDKMYIDNVNLYYLTEEEPVQEVEVTSVAFADGTSVALKVGESKSLTVNVLPEDAADKSLTFTSSNEAVATVDKDGKVTAVAKGACSITVTSANGKTAEIAIVVKEATQPSDNTPTDNTPSTAKKGCKSAVSVSLIATIALGACTAIVYKKRREER